MATKKAKLTLPGVLSFQRGIIPSDAVMENIFEEEEPTPIKVIRHGIRGTQNVNKEGEKDAGQIQITESAKTDPEAKGMAVTFSLKILPLEKLLHACASAQKDKEKTQDEVRAAISEFLEGSKESRIDELCLRYARNLLNGRWLWRNLILAKSISIEITEGDKVLASVEKPTSREDFNNPTEQEKAVAKRLKEGFLGGSDTDPVNLTIRAEIDFGCKGSLEVFPSQNYIDDKPKGFARSLYKLRVLKLRKKQSEGASFEDFIVRGDAALRDQKIGNAIRTIDTWHGGGDFPIAVEPKGANIEQNKHFRTSPDLDGFKLMGEVGTGELKDEQALFVLACMIRGGVYGGENEKKTEDKKGSDE
jgi:CRISPR-associated protein Csy3